MQHRNDDPELRDGLPVAPSGEELRERLPIDEDDPEIPHAWIQDRVRGCSRKTKVSTKAGLMSTRACHTFLSFVLFRGVMTASLMPVVYDTSMNTAMSV